MNRIGAEAILARELAAAGHPRVSARALKAHPRQEATSHLWWHHNHKPREDSATPRSLGYLRAYAIIAGDRLLDATGLRLDDGYLWLDRSVIKRLERVGYLRWAQNGTANHFEITPKGALLLARG